MNKMRRTAVAMAVAALLLAACGGDVQEEENAVGAEEENGIGAEEEPADDSPDDDDAAASEDPAQDEGDLAAPVDTMECDTSAEPSGDPIVVGGSLSLTGPLAPTATIHDAVGNIVVEWVNECGGLLGQPLEWEVLDDQSTPDQAASNYERLAGRDVDLVIGPYGGANILAGAGPVGQAGYIYPTHTNGAPDAEIGDFHFPSWQIGAGAEDPDEIFAPAAGGLWDALESTGNPPETVFYATAKFPTTLSLASATQSIAEEAGAQTADSIEYDLGTTDFSSIALRISSADPDLVYLGGLAADAVNLFDAFAAIGYEPRGIYAALPSPATLPGIGDAVEGLMVLSIYEDHAPFTDDPVAQTFSTRFGQTAEEENLFPVIETQAAASFGAWQIVLTAVTETGEVDNDVLRDWLNANTVDTIAGELRFDGWNNYGVDLNRVTQIQDGRRVIVWPEDVAGAEIRYPR